MERVDRVERGKRRGMRFYAEMIVVTVLSLLAASLWIEYVKGFVARHFDGHPSALMAMALLITLLAIGSLHFLFSDGPEQDEEEYTPDTQLLR